LKEEGDLLRIAAPAREAVLAGMERGVEVFNVFDRKNYRSIETNMTSSRFGAVTDLEPPRIAQLGAKFTF